MRFNLSPVQFECPNDGSLGVLSDPAQNITSNDTPESDTQFLLEGEKDVASTQNKSDFSILSKNRRFVEYQRVCVGDDVASGVSCS